MLKKSVITIGTFDGVHKGHQLLIRETLSIAKKKSLRSVLIVLEKPIKKVSGLLTIYQEKQEEFKSLGFDEIYVLKVPSDILSIPSDKFFDEFLLNNLNVDTLICGCDFAFGKDRKGCIVWLKEKVKNNNVNLHIVNPLRIVSQKVSSSYIRRLVELGNVKGALKFLGRFYSFIGYPFKDKGTATQLGYPTVNLRVSREKLIPKGIYISVISDGVSMYASITSIGIRPTFSKSNEVVPETHILNFEGIWKHALTKVMLLEKIRDEKKFDSVEALKKQISKDVKKAENFFQE
jgi:riboflavin kinase/FMN adenylyltransferase